MVCMLGNSGLIDGKGLLTFFYTSSRASMIPQMVKCLPTMQDTQVWSLGREDSPGEGTGNPLQYSCLEILMDGGAWWATVHGFAKSWTWLSNFTFYTSRLKIFHIDWSWYNTMVSQSPYSCVICFSIFIYLILFCLRSFCDTN